MKKIYLLLLVFLSIWQGNSQVLNQSAGWPNPAWTVTGTYNTSALAFEANPTTTANFAFDDDDAGNGSVDFIAAESPVINLTPAFNASEFAIKVDVQYGYNFLADVLRFEYWNASTSTWVAWGGNLPENNNTITNDFCTIPKTLYTTPILNISGFNVTQLTGFKYRISFDDGVAQGSWDWGFCFSSPVISSLTCPAPTAGIALVTSSSTANLSWTSGGAANAEIVVQLAGTGTPSTTNDTGIAVSGTTYSATGLLAQTAYEFYVRDECVSAISLSSWSGPFAFNTTQIPDCASNPSPADGDTTVPAFSDIVLSWNAPTTGDPATSYDIYVGDSPSTLDFALNITETSIFAGQVGAYDTTIYWQIIPRNIAGEAVGCAVWSFTTEPLPVCLSGILFPSDTVTPTVCDGYTENLVSEFSWAGDRVNVNVVAGQTYSFRSSVPTDYLTISTDNDVTGIAAGITPLTWVATITGVVSFHINTDSSCGTEEDDRITSIVCGVSCLDGTLFPEDTFIPDTCDGTTLNEITDDAYAGEYSNVQVQYGQTYTFSSSVSTDFFTISTDDGATAVLNGVGPLSWVATLTGVVRVYLHTDDSCGEETTGRFKWVICTPVQPCLSATYGQWPEDVFVPSACDGVTNQEIVANGYAGEYSVVTVTSGETYTFSSSIATDIITISADAGTSAAAVGIGSVTWVATVSGDVWFYTHLVACGEDTDNRFRYVLCGVVTNDSPDYVALQWPPTITIAQGGSGTVYGQIYEGGLTDVAPNITGQAPGITAWVGISPEGSNTNPNTWTTWIPSTWNSEHVSNNDEYQATIGADLTPGTYYYATRFRLNSGAYAYGGINSNNDGSFWDGTNYVSGILTVNPPPAPANDECSGAIALTTGGVFADYPITTTNFGATTTALATPSCQANFADDVWYSVVVPASGNITIETQITGSGYTDSVVAAFSGSCSTTLTQVGCDDDLGAGFMSLLSLTGQTPGSTLYIGVWRFSLGAGVNGTFNISAYDASLANEAFDTNSFSFYPNPVKDVLNFSYSQNITKVQVINLLGQEVSTQSINATQSQIDMSNLPTGTYLVKVTADNQVKTIKVIKE